MSRVAIGGLGAKGERKGGRIGGGSCGGRRKFGGEVEGRWFLREEMRVLG